MVFHSDPLPHSARPPLTCTTWAALRRACCGLLLCILWWAGLSDVWAQQPHADTAPSACRAHTLGSWVAAELLEGQRPQQGWVPVQLPQTVGAMPALGSGPVWFRSDWQLECPPHLRSDPQMALAISGLSQSGAVYWNEQLLWRSRSLVEPLSLWWNTPQWWPVTVLNPDAMHSVWVRVVNSRAADRGLGLVDVGESSAIQALHAKRYARQHTSYVVAAALAAAVACIAWVVWCQRRQERSYFWLGGMQAFWAVYLCAILSTETWPGLSSSLQRDLSLVCLMLYAQCFFIFTLCFGGQRNRWVEGITWALLALWACVFLPTGWAEKYRYSVPFLWCGLLFAGTGVYFQWRAWHTRNPQHLLLAVCWLVVLVLGIHDSWIAMLGWYNFETWSAFYAPVVILMLGVLMGWKVAEDMRRIDGFNTELTQRVELAQAQLAASLAREHQQALEHAKIQERMQLAHDLHDGLGGSLVRSMAMLEQAPQPLGNDRLLSVLKSLRDDLRQIIDAGSGSGAQVPETPVAWLAPLRHRVNQVLESLQVQSRWHIAPQWQRAPSATQCLALLRILEEALANTIKHSAASCVQVECTQSADGVLQLTVQDNGRGFDVAAVQRTALSVGMRSMQDRAQRMGARWSVHSAPGGTVMQVCLSVESAQTTAQKFV